jgi:hypothetical protein
MFPPFDLEQLKKERAEKSKLLDLLTSGKMTTGGSNGAPPVDTTAKWIEHFQNDLAELDRFIARFEQEAAPFIVSLARGRFFHRAS